MRQHRSTLLLVLILAGSLLASPSWGATARRGSADSGLTASARTWVLGLFGKLPPVKPQPPRKAGCGVDPNGTRCG